MLKRKEIVMTTLIIAALFFLGSCGGGKLKVKPVSKTKNPAELISRLDNDIANARKNQVNVLSPIMFAKAEESLTSAKKRLAAGGKLLKLREDITMGRTQLSSAENKAQISRNIIAKTIQGRDMARSAGAVKLGKDYTVAEEAFLDLTKALEKNNLKYTQKNREKVTENFRQLELRAIKTRTLGKVRKLIAEARKNGIHKIVPKSYALAHKALNEADEFITKNPYKKEIMREKADFALFMALRMIEIAHHSEKIENMRSEGIAILHEGVIYRIAERLSAQDMRNHSFDMQVDNILETIQAKEYDRVFLKEKNREYLARIDILKKQIAGLEGQSKEQLAAKERLIAEKRFNQLFYKVQDFFKSKEAEIYKKENQLIIRLKAMKFPVGKSVILPSNYALLSKVQRVIRTFGEVDVVIEGHTDSTGSADLNEHLSEQRADAVRQYLVANETLPFDKIIAVGYGSTRPLVSNSTEKGRAINRRIDLIITPYFKLTR